MRPEIIKINSSEPEASLVNYVADQIRKGHVLGIPTDTFYGFAVDPYNLQAVDRIYEIKNRQRNKPLSLILESAEQAEEMAAHLPDEFYLLTEKFWPGPLTVIVKAAPRLPLRVTANSGNIAVRVPAAKIPVAIVKAFGFPITATAASLGSAPDCTSAQEVSEQLGDRVSVVVDGGPSALTVHSTIVNLSTSNGRWKLLREGAIPVQEIEDLLGDQ